MSILVDIFHLHSFASGIRMEPNMNAARYCLYVLMVAYFQLSLSLGEYRYKSIFEMVFAIPQTLFFLFFPKL